MQFYEYRFPLPPFVRVSQGFVSPVYIMHPLKASLTLTSTLRKYVIDRGVEQKRLLD